VQKGMRMNFSDDDYQSSVVATLNYAEVPLLLKGVWGTEKQFTVFGGPAFSYAISGTVRSKEVYNGEKTKDKEKIDWDDIDFNRFEASAQLGVGGSLKAGRGSVELEARYEYGITNLSSDETSEDKISNRGVAISVGYTIPLSGKK
ncbi:MAG: outer membrane beta-barrel protein, partial [Chitinophagales bacterium]